MLRWRKRIKRITYIMSDIVCLLLANILSNVIYVILLKRDLLINGLEHIGFFSISTVILIAMFRILSIYENTIENNGHMNLKIFAKMLVGYILTVVFLGAGFFYLHATISRLYIGIFLGTVMFFQIIDRVIMEKTQFKDSRRSEAVRNILVVGQSEKGKAYIEEIEKHRYLDMNIIGYISIKKPNPYSKIAHLGPIESIVDIATDYVVDEIAVARPLSYDERLEGLLGQCQAMGITVTMLLDIKSTDATKAHVAMVGDIPVIKFHTVSLNETQLFMKRMLDICGALVGMIPFGIAFLIVGPLIKLETPGPVIFKQDRVGKNGRVFKVWKFRSMGVNAEKEKASLMKDNEMSGHMFKMSNDPRITKIGGFIRKTSIDELPQFYNVLRGDMSLVGTRPPTVNEVKEYERHHRRRISITPGITGNWQVSGRSDIEDFEEVVRLDSEYIENWSIWTDIRILFKTVLVVFTGRGSK